MPPRRNDAARVNVNRDDQMVEAINHMVASVVAHTIAKTLQDLEKSEREICAAESSRLEDFRRYNPPKFKGDEIPEKADQWIQEVEKIFEMINFQAMVKVNYVTYLLLGDAEYWWRSTRLLMGSAHKEENMTVGEYAAKFESLSRHFRFFREEVDEQFMCHRFQKGLKFEIQDSVLPLGIQRFQVLVEKCREVEDMKNKRANRGGNFSSGGLSRVNHPDNKGKQVVKPYNRPQNNNRG
ncbi:uncharacterized protein [Cicer arietinum]|uniref:Uncharacterized protein LOC101511649 n=1 Tax=Cicer arietinum TaxID=3827 RepID=A0A1S2Z7I0_CICAR|nr:uncharacterized protein LOC101511649 [Cicer arietinum]